MARNADVAARAGRRRCRRCRRTGRYDVAARARAWLIVLLLVGLVIIGAWFLFWWLAEMSFFGVLPAG